MAILTSMDLLSQMCQEEALRSKPSLNELSLRADKQGDSGLMLDRFRVDTRQA